MDEELRSLNEEEQTGEETAARDLCETAEAEESAQQTEKAGIEEGNEAVAKEASEEAADDSRKKKNGLLLGLAIAVVAIAAILLAVKLKQPAQTPVQEPAVSAETPAGEAPADETAPAEEAEIVNFPSYTISAEEATDEVMAKIVAVCGDKTLDNRMLAYFYWQEYFSFCNTYGSYLSFLLDQTKGLDQQPSFEEGRSWQETFLNSAVMTFQSVNALVLEAEKEGYVLPQEEQDYLDGMAESLNMTAMYYGAEDADALLKSNYGSQAALESYLEFARLNLIASSYLNDRVTKIQYTDADVEAYYDQNAESFQQSRVMKVDKPMVNIRHILIQPLEQNEDGSYTDEAWNTAKEAIDQVFAQWQSGEKTEEAFGQLAMEHSVDGSAANGGLIENVYPGQMVENFNDWCFADGRQVGDCEIVQTEYGYHIIFFSSAGEEIYWRTAAAQSYEAELAGQVEAEACELHPIDITLENAALIDVLAEQQAAMAKAQEEAAAQQQAAEQPEG